MERLFGPKGIFGGLDLLPVELVKITDEAISR
jgi:hypothetical protein